MRVEFVIEGYGMSMSFHDLVNTQVVRFLWNISTGSQMITTQSTCKAIVQLPMEDIYAGWRRTSFLRHAKDLHRDDLAMPFERSLPPWRRSTRRNFSYHAHKVTNIVKVRGR